MKVIFHEDFYQVYSSDPASAPGRMEAVVEAIRPHVDFVPAAPASEEDLLAVHTPGHVESIRRRGLYQIAALAAGGAILAAATALNEQPCFGLVRPPGHHASSDSAWGFCFFNNMSIALEALRRRKVIRTAYVLDIDLHFGDGTFNILGKKEYVTVYNVSAQDREAYLAEVNEAMVRCRADIIGISAGFDNHQQDWGGVLRTDDYQEIGRAVRAAASRCKGGCFALLEGGYNHRVLGRNVMALIEGLSAA